MIKVNYPYQYSDSFSCLLVSRHKDPEMTKWQL